MPTEYLDKVKYRLKNCKGCPFSYSSAVKYCSAVL